MPELPLPYGPVEDEAWRNEPDCFDSDSDSMPSDSDDDDTSDPSPFEMVARDYTHKWSGIDSLDEAEDFVNVLLEGSMESERRYIGHILFNRQTDLRIYALRERHEDRTRFVHDLEVQRLADIQSLTPAVPVDRANITLLRTPTVTDADRGTSDNEGVSTEAVGGAYDSHVGDGIEDIEDLRVYRLLQLADSIHDFDPLPTEREFLFRVDRCKLASAMGMDTDDSLPIGITLELMRDPGAFLGELCKHESLLFGQDVVQNPLYGKDITYRPILEGTYDDTDLWKLFRRNTLHASKNILDVQVWCPEHVGEKATKYRNKNIVCLSQICTLIARMKEMYGDDELTFILDDSQNETCKLVIATRWLSTVLLKRFTFYENEGYDAEYDRLSVGAEFKSASCNWNYNICDANLLDGQQHINKSVSVTLSRDCTGDVYRSDDMCRFRFLKVDGPDDDPSILIETLYRSNVKVNHKESPVSKNASYYTINDRDSLSQPFWDVLHDTRVGDWGQVEHCLKYDCVFVSTDRIAIAYAIYRKCKVLSINCLNNDSVKIKHANGDVSQSMLQFTFGLHAPDKQPVLPNDVYESITMDFDTSRSELINNVSIMPNFRPASDMTPEHQLTEYERAPHEKERATTLRSRYDMERRSARGTIASVDDSKLSDRYESASFQGGSAFTGFGLLAITVVVTVLSALSS